MRLLVLTQKVDKEDSVLGFFHNWIEKLSSNFEEISVICLEKGEVSLPLNVKIFSLGKEEGKSKVKYILNFYRYLFWGSIKYDKVLVHMNQEYVLLGGLFWKIFGKKVFMWRNHSYGDILTRMAVFLSDKVFCTSPSSYTAKFSKTSIMPVGIDTEKFKIESGKVKVENSILFLSRIARIKKPDLLIEALKSVDERGVTFSCDFYGDALPKDGVFLNELKQRVEKYGLGRKIKFENGVPNYKTPEIYNNYQFFINLTPSGSMDKTILEAGSCGTIPIIINDYFKREFPEIVAEENLESISQKIEFWLKADPDRIREESHKLQKYVLENHSLNALIKKLCHQIR